jgi:hypothetical protein
VRCDQVVRGTFHPWSKTALLELLAPAALQAGDRSGHLGDQGRVFAERLVGAAPAFGRGTHTRGEGPRAERGLSPEQHLMDAGYASAAHILAYRSNHDVWLVTPVRADRYIFAAVAVNLARMAPRWTGTPPQRTRTTHLARLDLALAA